MTEKERLIVQIAELKEKADSYISKVEKQNSEIIDLKNELVAWKKKCAKFEIMAISRFEGLEYWNNKCYEERLKVKSLTNFVNERLIASGDEILQKANKIEELKKEIKNNSIQLETQRDTIVSYQKKFDEFRVILANKATLLGMLHAKVENQKPYIAELKRQLGIRDAEIVAFRVEDSKKQKHIGQLIAQRQSIEDLIVKNLECETKIDQQRKEIEKLVKMLDVKQNISRSQDVQDLLTANRRYKIRLAEQYKKVADQAIAIEEAMKVINMNHTLIDGLKVKAEVRREEIFKLDGQIKSLKDEIKNHTSHDGCKEEIKRLIKRIGNLREEIEHLLTGVVANNLQHESDIKKIIELTRKYDKLWNRYKDHTHDSIDILKEFRP